MLAGRSSPAEIAEWVADAPAEVLAALRVRRHPLRTRTAPSRGCLTAVLRRIDTEALDRAVSAWLAARHSLTEDNPETGHGRSESRPIKTCGIDPALGQLLFPRAVTSLDAHQADPADLAVLIRGHWTIENRSHLVRDIAFREDACRTRTDSASRALTAFRNLTDRSGLPLSLGVSAANLHDSQALEPLGQGIPKIKSRRGPRRRKPAKLHADKAYDIPDCHRALRERRIGDRIARRSIESSARLSRHRWAVERTISWLGGYRRLTIRYERHGRLFAAFLALAAALTCYKKLAN